MALTSLPDDVLARMLAFAAPRDVEAVAVASKAVARHVLPRFPIWKRIFCARWAILNFPLDGADDERDAIDVEIDPRLRAQLPSSCSESRMFQLLAHAITPVPSYADIRATMLSRRGPGFGMMEHTIAHLNRDLSVCTLNSRRGCGARAVDIAFTGQFPGGNRSVRANTSIPPTFRVQVYKQRIPHSDSRFKYQIGVTASGYFEISIAPRKQEQQQRQPRISGSDLTSIGVGTDHFCLVGKQPGWDRHSFGYHGDDGQYYHKTGY
uniref:F-box domain-containing protein n=1 Tax=Globisporangium ultimum (strain ATCC 200006 / CBS 805.95 / DAOM BR144) TaxID=431595 RepID=K3W6V3_GLOUD